MTPKTLRKKHNLTQEQMACVIGCGYRTYQRLEAGEPSPHWLVRWFKHLAWLEKNAPGSFGKYLEDLNK